ncbi:MAG: CHAT domain-containing protein [Armatimonas sp.]
MDATTKRLLKEFAATPAGERRAYLEAHKAELTQSRLRALSAKTMAQAQAGQLASATLGGQFLELAGELVGEPLLRFDGAFLPAFLALVRGDGRTAYRLLNALEKAILTYSMSESNLTLCQQIIAVKRGAAAVQLGDLDALRAALQESATLLKKAPNDLIAVDVGNLAGLLLRYLGRFDDAIEALNDAATTADSLPNPMLAVQARINRAGAELAAGRPTDAEKTLAEALKTAPKTFTVELQIQRGVVLGLLEKPAESRAAFRAAQKIAQELSNPSAEARALLGECGLADDRNDRATVKALLARLKPLVETLQQPLLTFPYTAALGRLALSEKDPARAEALMRGVLPKATGALHISARLDLLLVLCRALVLQKKWEAADTALSEAEQFVEYQRSGLNDPAERSQFGEAYSQVYVLHAYVAAIRKQTWESLLLSERLRGLTLNELMRATDWRVQTRGLTPADADRAASFRKDEATAYAALNDAVTTDERESARTRMEQVATARKSFERALAHSKPLLALRGWGALPQPEQAARALFADSKPTCYLSFLTNGDITLVSGLIGKSGRMTYTSLLLPALTGPALNAAVKAFHGACASLDDPTWGTKGKLLFTALLEPIRSWWQSAERVVIVPDNALAYLPWTALRDPKTKKLFGEDRALSVAPSLTTLYYLSQRPASPKQGFVGYGACRFPSMPPLAQSGPEVKAIGALLGSKSIVRLAGDATALRLQSDAASARILHLATHGRAEESRPLESAVFLTPTPESDGIVTTRDLLSLPLDTDLVTLSACESALGTRFLGEGVVGPAWALLAAGSRSVLASHWKVDDNATRLLMTAFYKELSKGRPRADALRLAQKTLRTNPQCTHPCYWSAFSLHGVG